VAQSSLYPPPSSTTLSSNNGVGRKHRYTVWIWIWIVSRQGSILEHHTDEELRTYGAPCLTSWLLNCAEESTATTDWGKEFQSFAVLMLNDWRYGSVEDLTVTSFCWLALMPWVGLEDNTRSTEAAVLLPGHSESCTWRLISEHGVSLLEIPTEAGEEKRWYWFSLNRRSCTPLNFVQLIRVLFGVWIPYYGCIFHSGTN